MAAIMASSSTKAVATRPAASIRALKVASPVKPVVAMPAAQPANRMQVWQPVDNKMFETFSYLPPLSDEQIAKQVDYIVGNGWTPCLEFASPDKAYVSNDTCIRFQGVSALYYDNRYWTMWKLPMFGCRDGIQVLKEVVACTRAFPDCYVRLIAFDPNRQVQVMSFLVQRPKSAKDWKPVDKRSL